MMYRESWKSIPLFLLISFLAACAARPRVDIYIEPVVGKEGTLVDERTGALTTEQHGVEITVGPLDEVELFELTKRPEINPYIGMSRWGNVEPLYTVFEITVRNSDNKRVEVGETAILIDEHGEQYGSLPYDFFKDLYQDERPRTAVYHDTDYWHDYPYPRSYYRSRYRYYFRRPFYPRRYYPFHTSPYHVYHVQPDTRVLNNTRMFTRASIFDGSKLFPGAKRMGLLVFDRLDIDTTDMKVVIPEVRITDNKGSRHKVNFEFDFRQVVAVEER